MDSVARNLLRLASATCPCVLAAVAFSCATTLVVLVLVGGGGGGIDGIALEEAPTTPAGLLTDGANFSVRSAA